MTKPVAPEEVEAEEETPARVTFHDLLHAIVEKLPVHETEKAELHTQIDDHAESEGDNGNAN
jgi:hypothetical protein